MYSRGGVCAYKQCLPSVRKYYASLLSSSNRGRQGNHGSKNGLIHYGFDAILGKPLFEMCWFFMGIAQIASEPHPLSVKGQTWTKSARNHLGKPLHPPLSPLSGNAHMETTHFSKGLPLAIENAMWNVELKDG